MLRVCDERAAQLCTALVATCSAHARQEACRAQPRRGSGSSRCPPGAAAAACRTLWISAGAAARTPRSRSPPRRTWGRISIGRRRARRMPAAPCRAQRAAFVAAAAPAFAEDSWRVSPLAAPHARPSPPRVPCRHLNARRATIAQLVLIVRLELGTRHECARAVILGLEERDALITVQLTATVGDALDRRRLHVGLFVRRSWRAPPSAAPRSFGSRSACRWGSSSCPPTDPRPSCRGSCA